MVEQRSPKPRAEGSSPSAPAKNGATAFAVALFFVTGRNVLATRHGCALRSACRGVSERQWRSAANRPRRQPRQVLLPLPKNRRKHWVFAGFLFACVAWLCGALWFGHWVFSPWFYSFPTVLIPSSTQNAPGFAFFWLNRVRFPLFCCFSGAKFSCWFLCILPHSGYKLKPSVIPCRREVSFLT